MARSREQNRRYYLNRLAAGRERGLTPAQSVGHGRRVGLPTTTELRATGDLPAKPAGRRGGPLRLVSTPAGDIAYTGSKAVVVDQVRAAAARGDLVAFKVNFPSDRGAGYSTRIVDGNPEQLAALQTAVDAGRGGLAGGPGVGGRPAKLDAHTQAGRRSRAGIEVRTGSHPGTYHRGFDPVELLALFDSFDGDIWSAIWVLWALGYEVAA